MAKDKREIDNEAKVDTFCLYIYVCKIKFGVRIFR